MPPRSTTLSMSFPPFTGFIRRLILANVAVFFAVALLGLIAPSIQSFLLDHLSLTPYSVLHGQLWQLLTYSFLNLGIFDILFSMLSLWFIGSYLESTLGSRWTAELYFLSVLGAALTAVAFAYTHLLHLTPQLTIAGATGGIFGTFTAFAVLFGDQEMLLFPFPFRIRAKYLVAIYILLSIAFTLRGSILSLASLGGALVGYLFAKFAPRRGFFGGIGEWYLNLRNAWYRSKRRRAAKKFEVYMGKQGRTDIHFDKDGKYIDPDNKNNKNNWVN
jgi:membrane associated rhomboid family serine protease